MTELQSGYARTLFNLASKASSPELAEAAKTAGARVEIARRAAKASRGDAILNGLYQDAMDAADAVIEQLTTGIA